MNYSHEDAVKSILYGRSCAMRLKMRLDDPTAKEDGSVSSYDLAKSIVDCFSNAITNISDNKVKCEGDNQFLDLSSRDSSSPSSSHMTHSKKRKMNNTSPSENWRDDSPDPIHYDGFLWRKYGQKCIKKSVHQRSYYRCSYNKDYDCEARKHEQKIKDNPPVYRTTYFGQHTCKTNHNQEAIFATIDLDPVHDSRMIRFGKDVDSEKKPRLDCVYLPFKLEEDAKNKVAMVQRTGEINQDCQDLIEENVSPSSGSESSELLWENIDSWDFGDIWTDNL